MDEKKLKNRVKLYRFCGWVFLISNILVFIFTLLDGQMYSAEDAIINIIVFIFTVVVALVLFRKARTIKSYLDQQAKAM